MDDADTTPLPVVPGRGRHARREPDHSRPRAVHTGHVTGLGDISELDGPNQPPPGHGHGHGHGHGPPPPVSGRVNRLLLALIAPFALASLLGVILLWPDGDTGVTAATAQPVQGTVVGTVEASCQAGAQVGEVQQGQADCLAVSVRMSDGPAPDTEITTTVPVEPATPRFAVGDEVVLAYAGGDPAEGQSYSLVDFQRGTPMLLLAVLFALTVLTLGRFQGLKALLALALSFVTLLLFVLPAVVAGQNPLLVAIAGAGVIMFVVLYLTHGVHARTSTAVLGTMVSLALIGALGIAFTAFTRLTGLDEDTSLLVATLGRGIDTRGLLLAGVIIGALGVLDDVTVTQASAVWELRRANPSLSAAGLYAAALRIGRDHVASAVNTLVMAYAGAALPVLLYSSISGVGLGGILTSQSIAQEVVRTLVGSIGLVAAVPVTTAIAAAVAVREPVDTP